MRSTKHVTRFKRLTCRTVELHTEESFFNASQSVNTQGKNKAQVSGRLNVKRQPRPEEALLLAVLKERECCLALAGWREAMMQPLMHIMESFLSDLIPPLSISSSSFALQSVVPFFFQLPLSIYLLPASSLHHPFSDSPSSSYLRPSLSRSSQLPKPYFVLIHPSFPPSHHSFPMLLTDRQVHTPSRRPHNPLVDGWEV